MATFVVTMCEGSFGAGMRVLAAFTDCADATRFARRKVREGCSDVAVLVVPTNPADSPDSPLPDAWTIWDDLHECND